MTLTKEQFSARHLYCVTPAEVRRDLSRSDYTPKRAGAVCDHPEDGVCGIDISDATLQRVNDRLAGIVTPVQAERAERKAEEAARPKKPLPEGLQRWLAAKKAAQA